jgi:hypothetical protein
MAAFYPMTERATVLVFQAQTMFIKLEYLLRFLQPWFF